MALGRVSCPVACLLQSNSTVLPATSSACTRAAMADPRAAFAPRPLSRVADARAALAKPPSAFSPPARVRRPLGLRPGTPAGREAEPRSAAVRALGLEAVRRALARPAAVEGADEEDQADTDGVDSSSSVAGSATFGDASGRCEAECERGGDACGWEEVVARRRRCSPRVASESGGPDLTPSAQAPSADYQWAGAPSRVLRKARHRQP
ncbi:unnamed protein product [Prorocentrum cordatum]|uniref:Uncharacterized protein n=1 Tax=Prorocentrum cordatum TaxID=2364126 RepID=A0ABN9PI44_9DINO|nr:unnamed protein product [Polarella glacialis]